MYTGNLWRDISLKFLADTPLELAILESHMHVAADRKGTVDILGWKHGVKVTASRRIALYTRMIPQKQYVVMLCFPFLPSMKLKNGYDGYVD